jgi:hypothetical protein
MKDRSARQRSGGVCGASQRAGPECCPRGFALQALGLALPPIVGLQAAHQAFVFGFAPTLKLFVAQ